MLERTDDSLLARWWFRIDKSILFESLFLISIGCLLVFSASPYSAARARMPDAYYYVKKYMAYFGLGLATLLAASMMPGKNIRRMSVLGTAAGLAALLSTLFFAATKGGKRWIPIDGFKLQPSEFLKPVVAVAAAMMLVRIKELSKAGDIRRMKRCIGALIGMFAAIAAMLLMQPDLGMTLTFFAILFAEAFVAGLPWKWTGLLVAAPVLLVSAAYFTIPHVASRIDGFMAFDASATTQLGAGMRAIREAGLFGGHANNLKRAIPDVHTDFIFSAMVEEFGVLLAILAVGIFFMLGARILSMLKAKKDPFTIYAASGITMYLMFQVCVNLASTMGLIPTKGMTLPFISYGGSSFVSSCMAIGIVLALLGERTERNAHADE
ncbi:MAG: FtsW/RodA/SpoVE family cell cycle protein [Rickettsiales bacterium]|jgi:cell division protein FtsW|nr:FtsW/RodA/SpoVE family cell cycle protein [Rickettsiales bacterium]